MSEYIQKTRKKLIKIEWLSCETQFQQLSMGEYLNINKIMFLAGKKMRLKTFSNEIKSLIKTLSKVKPDMFDFIEKFNFHKKIDSAFHVAFEVKFACTKFETENRNVLSTLVSKKKHKHTGDKLKMACSFCRCVAWKY